MSTYYYFLANGTNEYFELTSGGWYCYMEDLHEVLNACLKGRKPYSEFRSRLIKQKVFEGFYDDNSEFVTDDEEKYFLQPLYNWAFKHSTNSSYYEPIALIADDDLYETAIHLFCEEKGLKYERPKMFEYSPEIKKALAEYDKTHRKTYWDKEQNKWVENNLDEEETLIDHYLKCVGKLNYDSKIMCEVGVGFEQALAEMKAGAKIWRKSEPDTEYWVEDGALRWSWGETTPEIVFYPNEIFADDWEYKHLKK